MNKPVRRWIALVALLLIEGLALGIAFDSEHARASLPRGWWTPVVAGSGSAMPAATVVLTALVLLVWSRRRAAPALTPPIPGSSARSLFWLILHLMAFSATYVLSRELFGDAGAPRAAVGALVAGWMAAVSVTIAAWIAALVPARVLIAWARGRRVVLLGGAALGLVAFAIAHTLEDFWDPLRRATFSAAAAALRFASAHAWSDPESLTLGTNVFAAEIAAECSGYEGVLLTSTFVLAALWLFRAHFRFPNALVLLLLAAVLPWVANVARLAALVLIGTHLSPQIAAGGFHSYAGSILFCSIALGIVALGLRVPWLSDATSAPVRGRGVPAAPYLVPFLAMTAAGLVSKTFSGHAEPLFALRAVVGLATLAWFWRSYAALKSWTVSWTAVPAGLAVAGLWLGIDWLFPHPAPGTAGPSGPALVVHLTTALALAPVVEELAFRGFLARRVCRAEFDQVPATQLPWHALVLSSLAFAVLHRRMFAAFAAAMVYGLLYRRRGSLGDAVVAHATTNAALALVAWSTGDWRLWT